MGRPYMDTFTKCERCGAMAVQSKTVFFRELNANMRPKGQTETVIERECQQCGWMISEPEPAMQEPPAS